MDVNEGVPGGLFVSINWGGASDSCIRMKVNAISALEIYGDQELQNIAV